MDTGSADGVVAAGGVEERSTDYPHAAVVFSPAADGLFQTVPFASVEIVVLGADVGEIVTLPVTLFAPSQVGFRSHVAFVPARVGVVFARGLQPFEVGVAAEVRTF